MPAQKPEDLLQEAIRHRLARTREMSAKIRRDSQPSHEQLDTPYTPNTAIRDSSNC